eukprot:TRINITY_DN17204_c0_g3_i3.p1 TRINITY_DN17204_c0_g3~~TRINITY_DN17204_c0_g3_i3.p1  ORF type:complete len:328 (+),score=56.51 TRINITY_DN17204_c0_g3_i3:30-986(+)
MSFLCGCCCPPRDEEKKLLRSHTELSQRGTEDATPNTLAAPPNTFTPVPPDNSPKDTPHDVKSLDLTPAAAHEEVTPPPDQDTLQASISPPDYVDSPSSGPATTEEIVPVKSRKSSTAHEEGKQEVKLTEDSNDATTKPQPARSEIKESPAKSVKKPKYKASDAGAGAWTAFPDLEKQISNKPSPPPPRKASIPKALVQPPSIQPAAPEPHHKASTASAKSDNLNKSAELEFSRSESSSTLGTRDEQWESNDSSNKCRVCKSEFGIFNRKHHCRKCGRLVCNPCSSSRGYIDDNTKGGPVRLCDDCVRDARFTLQKPE